MGAMDERVEIVLGEKDRRLYDRLRARLVGMGGGRSSGLGDLMLLLPDLVVLVARLSREPRVPRGGKLIAALALGYVVSPIDLIPEFLGPIGFMDDALVLAAALSRLVNYVHPDVLRLHWSGKGDVLEGIQNLTEWSESFLVDRLPSGLRRLLPKKLG